MKHWLKIKKTQFLSEDKPVTSIKYLEEALDCCVYSAFSQNPSSLYPVQSMQIKNKQECVAWSVGICQLVF